MGTADLGTSTAPMRHGGLCACISLCCFANWPRGTKHHAERTSWLKVTGLLNMLSY
jgi:hypothetical protein